MDNKGSKAINQFLKDCNSCGECKEACPFLEKYGTPDIIISEKSEGVFSCTNCRACDSVCPQHLLPSDALHTLKYEIIKDSRISEKTKNTLNSAISFARRGHKFPFSCYPKTDAVFWPGCSLAGTSPAVIKKTVDILSKQLNKKVGLALDCCFDPAFQNGDLDTVSKYMKHIKMRFEKHGVKQVILGCVNCRKIFSLYMTEINAKHIFEVLPENLLSDTHTHHLPDKVFLHHPCPSWRFDEIRQNAKQRLQSYANISDELSHPMCCGLGGGVSSLDIEMSEKFREKVISNAGDSAIVTYCMGCKKRFLNSTGKTYHLLEILTNTGLSEKPVSSAKKWINRFMLSMSQKLNTKKIIMALLVLFLILSATYLRELGYISPESLFEFISTYKILAPALFIFLYSIGPSLFIPSLPLTIGAGFLWGPFWGVVFSITGATLGASVAFLIARYILGDAIKERFSYSRWQWLKGKVERHGWKAVAFSRIVPIFPFPVLNYLFGITPIPFLHYLWSTFVFMLPACIAFVAFGSSMGELILKGNIEGLIIGILIATAALLLPLLFKPIVKKVFPEKVNHE
jgi:uncharacterized membrane protein YdjX (TVP38/TMEM64 family)/Fe-S oxidoreductase